MRTTLKAAAALAVPLLALAACGGTAATSGHAATAAPSVTVTASWPSARAIAEQVGATGIQPSTPSLYASDEVTATWHGRNVAVVTFASVTLKERWVEVASQFTPILTEGPQFAISDNGPAT